MVSKISEDVYEQIKELEKEYQSVIDKLIPNLIPNEKLREQYKKYGLCRECKQPNTGFTDGSRWCQPCNSKHLQEDFNKWTSGNKEIDGFIQNFQLRATNRKELLEWIPYDKFENIEFLTEGGFGTVYKAKWIEGNIENWDIGKNKLCRYPNVVVVLKCLNNSQNITIEFLQEITLHKKITNDAIVQCFGISQDPKTKNFMMVMQHITNGSMSQFLKNNKIPLTASYYEFWLWKIASGLAEIHNKGFIHKDLHSGNILSRDTISYYIADLGLCRPADQTEEKKIYGVLPYIAPEVLKNKTYTQASDIYSFGILACEMLSGLPPYHNLPHDGFLALKVCQGLRPKLDNIKIPPLLEKLIDQCLDADPLKRPTADELSHIFRGWVDGNVHTKADFCKVTKQLNNKSEPLTIHSQAVYISKPLNFENLPKPQNSKEINDEFYLTTSEYSLAL